MKKRTINKKPIQKELSQVRIRPEQKQYILEYAKKHAKINGLTLHQSLDVILNKTKECKDGRHC